MTEWKARRFWSAVTVVDTPHGHGIRLDDRPVKTPLKNDLAVPSRALAEGIATEWDAQGDVIAPLTMPLTRAANTAVERVIPQCDALVDELSGYGETDLLCYRAESPDSLVQRQSAAWDPMLEWAAEAFGARLVPVQGVMFQDQPRGALEALRARVATTPVWELVALSEFVTLSGSLVLGLAVLEGQGGAAELWPLARVDEDWQAEQWGADEEEAERVAHNRAAFLQAEVFLSLLRAG